MSISPILDVLSGALVLAGCVCVVSGGVGLLRFPDFYTRTHAGSLTDSAGAGLLIAGLLVQAESWASAIRLVLILIFMMLTGPAAVHALAQAARRDGEEFAGAAGRDGPGRDGGRR